MSNAGQNGNGAPATANMGAYPLVPNPQTSAAAGGAAGGAAVATPYGANPQAQPGQQNPNLPQWLKGLMGATTGNAAYGANAPAINKAIMGGLQMAGAGQQRPMQQPPMMGHPGMAGGPPVQLPGQAQQQPITPPWMQQPSAGQPGAGMPGGGQQMTPQLQALLQRLQGGGMGGQPGMGGSQF